MKRLKAKESSAFTASAAQQMLYGTAADGGIASTVPKL
jgi:hypothetical protein